MTWLNHNDFKCTCKLHFFYWSIFNISKYHSRYACLNINFIYWDLKKIPHDFNVMLISTPVSLWRNYWTVETQILMDFIKICQIKILYAFVLKAVGTNEWKSYKFINLIWSIRQMAFSYKENDTMSWNMQSLVPFGQIHRISAHPKYPLWYITCAVWSMSMNPHPANALMGYWN